MARAPGFSRWWLVAAAALAMGAAGTYQFVWSSVRVPLGARLGAGEAALGTTFTLFVVFQTVSQFPAGWVRDRYGPRLPLLVGAGLLFAGYAGTAAAGGVRLLYLSYAVGGVGVGVAYTVAVNTSVKWFTERRGLATGVVTMSYAGVSFLLIPAVRRGLTADVSATLLGLGGVAALGSLVGAAVLRDPAGMSVTGATDGGTAAERDREEPATEREDAGTGRDGSPTRPDGDAYTWREAVRTWQFWLLYGVFVVVNGVGLMVIGKVVAFASALGLPGAAATASASLVALSDAGGVLVGGGVSDRLGRERTVALTLVLCGLALGTAVAAGEAGLAWPFVALVGAAAFFRSPPFSVFPSLTGSYYGEARSSENYALLYTAKLWGGVFGGVVASALVVAIGWSEAFALGAAAVALAGLATFLLRPV